MNDSKNRITVRGLNPHRSLLRSIECQTEKWIARWQAQNAKQVPAADYQIRVERAEVEPHARPAIFYCSLWVRIGTREWRALESGKTIQQAVDHALKRLRSPRVQPALA